MMKKKSNINERILYLIEKQYNNNQKKFAESIGYSAQVVFNIVSGRKTKPSFEVLSSIISTNVYVNAEWLLTGKGEMLKEIKEELILNEPNERYGIDYKELADARLETINSQKQNILLLNEKLNQLNQNKSNSKPMDQHLDR